MHIHFLWTAHYTRITSFAAICLSFEELHRMQWRAKSFEVRYRRRPFRSSLQTSNGPPPVTIEISPNKNIPNDICSTWACHFVWPISFFIKSGFVHAVFPHFTSPRTRTKTTSFDNFQKYFLLLILHFSVCMLSSLFSLLKLWTEFTRFSPFVFYI